MLLDLKNLSELISAARNQILKPAFEQANAVKLAMLRHFFGEDFKIEDGEHHGFSLFGISISGYVDVYQNLIIKKITGLPAIASLQKFAEAVLYIFEGYGIKDKHTLYPFRTVSDLMIRLCQRFESEIDKSYAEEMLRVGDLYCEKNSGFRKWALGTPPRDQFNLGTTANLSHWKNWFK